jgi:ribosomal protein L11
MNDLTIQDKIKTTFMNAISESSKFTEDEIKDIAMTISSSLKADKMAESILKSIGGTADEDS